MAPNLRQFHPHEHSGHEETQQHTDEANEQQEKSVELWNIRRVGSVQDDEAQPAHGEQETGGQAFHDVLSIHPETETRSQ